MKLHENRRTGQCNPSYQTIATETGLSRPTVIKYAHLLQSLKLIKIVPIWTSRTDRTSNQYKMVDPSDIEYPETKPIPPPDELVPSGKMASPPPEVSGNSLDYPDKIFLPQPDPLNQIAITKEKTPEKAATLKQKTCTHPTGLVIHLDQDINICNHCFGLLDDNGQLVEETPESDIAAA